METDRKPPPEAGTRPLLGAVEGPELGVEHAPLRLPVRAAIYIAPDGTVHFGALFEELAPVAESLRTAKVKAQGR